MATTNLFYHPVFKDGAFSSTDPRFASTPRKVMHAIDVGAELGARYSSSGAAGKGWKSTRARNPVKVTKWFRDSSLPLQLRAEQRLPTSSQHRAEGRTNRAATWFLPTVGSVLAFIATVDHPEMVGINPETAHIKMAGLTRITIRPGSRIGQAVDVHLTPKALRYDQDLSFGSDI